MNIVAFYVASLFLRTRIITECPRYQKAQRDSFQFFQSVTDLEYSIIFIERFNPGVTVYTPAGGYKHELFRLLIKLFTLATNLIYLSFDVQLTNLQVAGKPWNRSGE